MKIFIVGSGKLANALLSSGMSFPACEVIRWDLRHRTWKEKAIVVHAGSGRQLDECLEFCSSTNSTFVELATGLGTEIREVDFPLILCANTSILVIKMLLIIRKNSRYFEDCQISITESHQATKKTVPGTAYAFADALKVSRNDIVSIRDPEIQQNKIRIPEPYLDKHAFHEIVIRDGDDEITIQARVLGHSSYAQGVERIIGMILGHPLENRMYTVLELVGYEML